MIHSDKAVETIEQDLLGRKGFAKQAAKNILAWEDPDNLVVGLYGKWGDGKTSVKNFIKDLLQHPEKFQEEIKTDKIPTVIEFNPWIFSNQGSLIQSFLLEVGKELGEKDNETDREIARKLGLIRLYLNALNKIGKHTELALVRTILPALGLSLAVLLDKVFSFSPAIYASIVILILILEALTFSEKIISFFERFYKEKARLQGKTLNRLKEDIKQTLSRRDRKILFVIDDIDRLTPAEIQQLFQLIKINLDLPNLIYLLVMDIDTVGKMITTPSIDGQEYIEKIVQFPISLPKADDKKLSEFLFAQLDDILKFFSEDKWDKTRWGLLYQAGLGKIFLKRGNLRVIKRPINQIRSAASLISAEVDPVDFLGIRTIEYFHPNLYHFISNNKELFTTVNRHSQYEGKKLEEIRRNVEAELTKTDSWVKEVLLELFPSLKSVVQNYSFGDSTEKDWRQKRRICSPDHFGTYFFLDVPEGEMRSAEITSLVHSLESPSDFIALLQGHLKEGKEKEARNILKVLLDHVDSFPKDEKSLTSILTALFDITDELSKIETKEMFDFGADMDLARLIYFYLKALHDKKVPIFESSKKAIINTKSLYGAVHFLSLNDPRREGAKGGRDVLTANEAAELAKECVKKIKKANKAKTLKKEMHLLYILYRWREWGGGEEMVAFVNSYKKSKVAIADFVTHFKAITLSASGAETRRIPKIQFASLKEFMDLDYVKQKLDKVKVSELTAEQREAVELFKKDLQKKDDPHY